MRVIFQVNYPVDYLNRGLDLKIRKIFDDYIEDKNYEAGSGSGFGMREIEAETTSEYAPASVIQNIEDDLKTLFSKSAPKLKFKYFSKMHKWPRLYSKPDHIDAAYLNYRTITFNFNA